MFFESDDYTDQPASEVIPYVSLDKIPPAHLKYQSNRFSQDIGRYCHSSLKQFLRSIWTRIFGHESPVKITDLATNSHCPSLDTDFFRLAKLPPSATRKLLNPFKWIELVMTAPLEVVRWGFHRGFFKFRDWFLTYSDVKREMWQDFSKSTPTAFKQCFKKHPFKTLGACLLGGFLIIGTVASAIINEVGLSVLRRIVAPVRYIIRPSIELAKKHSFAFLLVTGMTLLAGLIATTVVTGGLNLALGSLIVGASAAVKTNVVVGVMMAMWTLALKATTGIPEVFSLLKNLFKGTRRKDQVVSQFQYSAKGTTSKITEALHSLDPKTTEVREVQSQDSSYSAALFFGVESLIYPSKGKPDSAQTKYIKFFDLKKYSQKRTVEMHHEEIELMPMTSAKMISSIPNRV